MPKDKEPKFIGGTIAYTKQPIAGVTLYQDRRVTDPTIEEMLEELEKTEIRDVRKDELLKKIRTRVLDIGKEVKTPTDQRNPKRYLVDPETGRVDVDEEEGELTYKDALLVSASIKGKSGQFDDAITLITTVKSLEEAGQPKPTEKPKEYYVDLETGIIVHDPDNGEFTLSEARAVSQSMKKSTTPESQPPPGFYVDDEGNIQELKLGQPIVVKKVVREPGKTYLLNPEGEVVEQEAGKPIIIKVQPVPQAFNLPATMPFPVFGADGQPAYDKDGKPIYANLEPVMKWMGFQAEQRRADERHSALVGMVQTVRENFGDGIAALKAAAGEIKSGTGAKTPAPAPQQPAPQQQAFSCGACQTKFSPPEGWAGQPLKCPNPDCGREYTKEELLG